MDKYKAGGAVFSPSNAARNKKGTKKYIEVMQRESMLMQGTVNNSRALLQGAERLSVIALHKIASHKQEPKILGLTLLIFAKKKKKEN